MRGAKVRGFSLVELLLATSLLVMAILTLFGALLSGSQLDGLSREKAHAVESASSQLESVLAEDWDDLASRHNETFDITVENETGASTGYLAPPSDRALPGLVSVVPASVDDLMEVEVSVKWRSQIGNDVQITLRTLVARH